MSEKERFKSKSWERARFGNGSAFYCRLITPTGQVFDSYLIMDEYNFGEGELEFFVSPQIKKIGDLSIIDSRESNIPGLGNFKISIRSQDFFETKERKIPAIATAYLFTMDGVNLKDNLGYEPSPDTQELPQIKPVENIVESALDWVQKTTFVLGEGWDITPQFF